MQQRIRTTKPEFYRHYELYCAEKETGLPLRLAFQALWTCCDREGRFEWRPEELKVLCMPYDDLDFSRVLDALVTRGWLVKYRVGTRVFAAVPTFLEHQHINNRESDSKIPHFEDDLSEILEDSRLTTRAARVGDACPTRHDLAPAERERERERERSEDHSSSEPQAAAEPVEEPLVTFPVVGDKKTREWHLVQSHVDRLSEAFPGLDVVAEAHKALGWIMSNPTRTKTARGMPKYLFGWMERNQNRGRAAPAKPQRKSFDSKAWAAQGDSA